jgi:hypothetical protein
MHASRLSLSAAPATMTQLSVPSRFLTRPKLLTRLSPLLARRDTPTPPWFPASPP